MRRAALLAMLGVSITLGAQQPLHATATRPNVVARTFLSFGPPYGGWLLLALDSIPASRYGFRPTPVQQSIGFIAQHLETANYSLCSTFGGYDHGALAEGHADRPRAGVPAASRLDPAVGPATPSQMT